MNYRKKKRRAKKCLKCKKRKTTLPGGRCGPCIGPKKLAEIRKKQRAQRRAAGKNALMKHKEHSTKGSIMLRGKRVPATVLREFFDKITKLFDQLPNVGHFSEGGSGEDGFVHMQIGSARDCVPVRAVSVYHVRALMEELEHKFPDLKLKYNPD